MIGSPHVVAFDERWRSWAIQLRQVEKGFVLLGAAIIGNLFLPSLAVGKTNGVRAAEIPGSATARERWAGALKKARQEGSTVVS